MQPVFFMHVATRGMIKPKFILPLFLLLLTGFTMQLQKVPFARWVITKGCSLQVVGSTNVNQFTCVIADYYKPDTLTFYVDKLKEPAQITGAIQLKVQNFDCHNPPMTANLRKALKAADYPHLLIKFISLNQYTLKPNSATALNGKVSITLAGVTKLYKINYQLVPTGGQTFTLVGSREVTFSDFNIIPPRKIGGLIKTDNALQVQFKLNVKVLD